MRKLILTVAALGIAPLAWAQADGGLIPVPLIQPDAGLTTLNERPFFTLASTGPLPAREDKIPPDEVAGAVTPSASPSPSSATPASNNPGRHDVEEAGRTNAEAAPSPQTSMRGSLSDERLLEELHTSNLAAIAEAGMAEDSARSERTKRFAEELKQVHADADREVVEEATRMGVVLIDALPPDRTAAIDQLENAAGPDFDRIFLEKEATQHDLLTDEIDAAQKTSPKVGRLCDMVLPQFVELALKAKSLELRTAKADTSSHHER